ncbi:Uncharacterized protein ALO43_01501 [Pseudomonas tremae]|uniref:Transmembrane protein n=1 Tax=Pseudomonas tremae TaxID=200454 RepID=A0AA40P1Y0_9PSED|nr:MULTISPECIES: hypothetical protein [Pseudomonas syringae group]KPY95157.1 Uncharacterized protein ALO43_01501 [Pseudomonas tremae]RMO10310.1 hypothetical protein ALQ48_00348 [Pseudomonas coronafaciens pv. zizaniae]
MALSHLRLASLLNGLARNRQALISEGPTSIVVSDLLAGPTLEVVQAASEAGWMFTTVDSQGSRYDIDEVGADFEPFRITLEKHLPSEHSAADDLFIATEVGFRSFLRRGYSAPRWHLLGLTTAFSTRARVYCGWGESSALAQSPATKAPRLLVKEAATVRTVPEDVRHWLYAEGHILEPGDPFHMIWAAHALNYLSRCFANEIDTAGTLLTFKGPPKLNLTISQVADDVGELSLSEFEVVQDAAGWVFDNSREAEVKHILLSAEIARSGRADGDAGDYFKENLAAALDCAKIAYQMAVSEITKDTLKSLGDLRKAVTEETSKATDATRQATAAIATALTVGLGLIAARLTVQINPYLIAVVMSVAFGYTLMSVWSGRKFIQIQQTLRQEWQPKLYRYLSVDEFNKMVRDPISEVETLFSRVSGWGLATLGIIATAIVIFAFTYVPPTDSDISAPAAPRHQTEPKKAAPRTRPPMHHFGGGMTASLGFERLLWTPKSRV